MVLISLCFSQIIVSAMVQVNTLWKTNLSTEKDESVQVPSQLALNHDGSRLIVSFGKRLSMYDSNDGKLIKHLKGHKDNIYSISYSLDGKRIASGGADNSTIIWNEEGKGILKFTHSDSVQVVTFNPVEDILASCSSSDFGFWSPNESSVVKYKVDSKVTCAAWRNDGQIIAIGLFSGKISMYNIYGNKIGIIDRNAPVLSICWNSQTSNNDDSDWNCLVVGCWDMTLSFYDEFSQQVCEDRFLDCYPTCVSYFGQSNEYVIMATSSGHIQLCQKDGSFLVNLCLDNDGWLWCVQSLIAQHSVVCINAVGGLTRYQIVGCNVAYDRWSNRFAYSCAGVDILVSDCSNGHETKQIRCKAMVEKLALLDDELAVVIKNELMLYTNRNTHNEVGEVDLICSLAMGSEISNITLTSKHIIVSLNKRVIAFDKTGRKKREWYVTERVSCFQNLCVIQEEERVFVGCEEGTIFILSLDSAFLSPLVKLEGRIASITLSCNNRFVGIICGESGLYIYDQMHKSFVVERKGSQGILFHDMIETLFCYNYNGVVTIADITHCDFLLEEATSDGVLICFPGLEIYLQLNNGALYQMDVYLLPLASKKIKDKEFDKAYDIAILGSPDSFFHYLAQQSLMNSDFTTAIKCYRYLNLPLMIDYVRMKKGNTPQDGLLSEEAKACVSVEIAAINGDYSSAEEICNINKCNEVTYSLIQMYVKLRMFSEAKNLMKGFDKKQIKSVSLQEAKWRDQTKDWKKASLLYCDCGHFKRGVEIIGDNKVDGWIEMITKLSKKIPSTEVEALKKCCEYLSVLEGMNSTVEGILFKIKDYSSLMDLYIRNKQWIEIGNLYNCHINDIDKSLMVPYANWLAIQGQLDKSINIFTAIGDRGKTIDFLHSLIESLIMGGDFKQVSLLHRILLNEYVLSNNDSELKSVFAANEVIQIEQLPCIFYAYDLVMESITNQLLSINIPPTETILNACVYLLKSIGLASVPKGISLVQILNVLSKKAFELGANKTAREALYRLRDTFSLSPLLRHEVAHQLMLMQISPDKDNEEVAPICYRCGTVNRLIEKDSSSTFDGDSCKSCSHPFIRCFLTFDILPLVEFCPTSLISREEALLSIKDYPLNDTLAKDLFHEAINTSLSENEACRYKPVDVDLRTLQALKRDDVYVIETSSRYFKNMIPEVGIAVCQSCQNFFHEEDYEYAYLKGGFCPVCEKKTSNNYGHL